MPEVCDVCGAPAEVDDNGEPLTNDIAEQVCYNCYNNVTYNGTYEKLGDIYHAQG